MASVGVVTGLDSERRVLAARERAGALIVGCAGASEARARAVAERLIAAGCRGLLSFGVAGGLDPGLAPGAVALPDRIVAADGETFDADAAWRERLVRRLNGAVTLALGPITGVAAALSTVEAKRAAFERAGAVAVDMESAAVAAAAQAAGIPFAAIRAVADPAWRAAPAWLADVIDASGRPRISSVVAGLARDPGAFAALPALARETRAALRSLSRVSLLCGALFEFDG